MEEFHRIKMLPPYVFSMVDSMKMEARRRGIDIVDLGMGNPDLPTPSHIVEKLTEVVRKDPRTHRYSASRGIPKLRKAICDWYKRRFDVDLDPDREAIVTLGSKEGLGHLVMATIGPGDVVFAPNPTYPIHIYSAVIAGGHIVSIPMEPGRDFFHELDVATKSTWPRPKLLIISFPHNPTTRVVDHGFFQKVVDYARENQLMVIHDFAYADLCFDGYQAPSFMQIDGAKEVGVETFTLSKSYSMPGWRVGFCVGNPKMINALGRLKSYLDYGIFTPIQVAAITALTDDQSCVEEVKRMYRERRDVLCEGLQKIGWHVEKPKATMFVWAPIPERFREIGSLEFSKMLLETAKVAVSPGVGFGDHGEGFVRFALVENRQRIQQAIRGVRKALGR